MGKNTKEWKNPVVESAEAFLLHHGDRLNYIAGGPETWANLSDEARTYMEQAQALMRTGHSVDALTRIYAAVGSSWLHSALGYEEEVGKFLTAALDAIMKDAAPLPSRDAYKLQVEDATGAPVRQVSIGYGLSDEYACTVAKEFLAPYDAGSGYQVAVFQGDRYVGHACYRDGKLLSFRSAFFITEEADDGHGTDIVYRPAQRRKRSTGK